MQLFNNKINIFICIRVFENTSDDEKEFLFNDEDLIQEMSTKRSDFRLNYNPYNLNKSGEEKFDKKQMKLLKKLALDNPKKTTKNGFVDINKMNIQSYTANENEEKKTGLPSK